MNSYQSCHDSPDKERGLLVRYGTGKQLWYCRDRQVYNAEKALSFLSSAFSVLSFLLDKEYLSIIGAVVGAALLYQVGSKAGRNL